MNKVTLHRCDINRFIEKMYQTIDTSEIATIVGLTEAQVRGKANYLGVFKSKKTLRKISGNEHLYGPGMFKWEFSEDEVLYRAVDEGVHFEDVVSELPGRTVQDCFKRYSYLESNKTNKLRVGFLGRKNSSKVRLCVLAGKDIEQTARSVGLKVTTIEDEFLRAFNALELDAYNVGESCL